MQMWQEGKNSKKVLSDLHLIAYTLDLTAGTRKPSFWLVEKGEKLEENLEKIALGMQLRSGSLKSVRLVLFEEECFTNLLKLKQASDFPVKSVMDFHYELTSVKPDVIKTIINKFLSCQGFFREFLKAKPGEVNMKVITQKYLQDVSPEYQNIAKKWI
ncbi:hypothetical protein G3T18_15035 [Oscillatoria salina IIICB1]|nr:hypothetical protein [Oscillatoria salina IIICB1]NET88318.1 hypothetical protein [Kamptonema sp. SIO1D9]